MLRRYTPLKAGPGTHFPPEIVQEALVLHGGCLGPRVGMPGRCDGPIDPDHIRASKALGRKSRSTLDNCAPLCRFVHHRLKTAEGRKWRPKLIEAVDDALARRSDDCHHVDIVSQCPSCRRRMDPLTVLS